MVDIHSHVLYELDDGAADRETSLAMLRTAAETGTTDLVATPHLGPCYDWRPELVAERVADLSEAAGGRPRLHVGWDFHLTYENVQNALARPSLYTINQRSYLLVEFSDLVIFNNSGEILAGLRNAGMVPIITHPERNGLLRLRLELLAEWVRDGSRLQVTAGSLLGGFGKSARRAAERLMDSGLVHFIASDAHDCSARPPRLDLACKHVSKHWGEEVAERLFVRNPAAVLTGEPLPALAVSEGSGRTGRKWYRFWG